MTLMRRPLAADPDAGDEPSTIKHALRQGSSRGFGRGSHLASGIKHDLGHQTGIRLNDRVDRQPPPVPNFDRVIP
jgi:hypothetical protein